MAFSSVPNNDQIPHNALASWL